MGGVSPEVGIFIITGNMERHWPMRILLDLFSFLGTTEKRGCRGEVGIALNVCTDSPLLVKKSRWYSYLRLCFSHFI